MKKILLLLICMPILLPGCSPENTTHTDAYSGPDFAKSSLELHAAENMVPNGEYLVSLKTADGWVELGRISCDKYYRDFQLPVPPSALPETLIRIKQSGGGAAHIDAVSLGGQQPLSVTGVKDGLVKLAAADYDVADAGRRSIEAAFGPASPGSELTIRARMEAEIISKRPVILPVENESSEPEEFYFFYDYIPGTAPGSHLVTEYCLNGSGHPPGYTYINAGNDDENLYVSIDFPSDNTSDGNVDYAKLYCRTASGLKEFRITTEETRWGSTSFVYTDKVSYQHKVYDFTIPMAEIGAGDISLELAFAIYGTTVGPTYYYSDMAFNTAASNFFIVYEYDPGDIDIASRLIAADGTPIGAQIPLESQTDACESPSVAYNAAADNYLAVWADSRTPATSIYGQLVPADGNLPVLSNFVIDDSAEYKDDPAVAWDSINNRYLVVYQNTISRENYIYGQLVGADGSLIGSSFEIDTAEINQKEPEVVFNPVSGEFLVVWHRDNTHPDPNHIIVANIVSAAGVPSASSITLSDTETTVKGFPAAACNEINGSYLVVWEDDIPVSEVKGRMLTSAGGAPASIISIADSATAEQWRPAVVWDDENSSFLVIWNDGRGSDIDIYGKRVSSDGTPSGSDFVIDDSPGDQFHPSLAINPVCQNYLAAFMDNDSPPAVISISSSGTGVSDIEISPSSLDFGIINAGESSPLQNIIAEVSCGGAIEMGAITVTGTGPADFTLTTDLTAGDSIASGSTETVGVTFTPLSGGEKSLDVTLPSDDPTEPSVTVSVSGIARGIPELLFPDDGAEEMGLETTFVWTNPFIPSSETAAAKLYLSTSPDFTGAVPYEVTAAKQVRIMAGMGAFGVILTAGRLLRRKHGKRQKRRAAAIVMLAAAVCILLLTCTEPPSPPSPGTGESSYTVTGLSGRTTYYWKVVTEFSSGASTESQVRSFTTW